MNKVKSIVMLVLGVVLLLSGIISYILNDLGYSTNFFVMMEGWEEDLKSLIRFGFFAVGILFIYLSAKSFFGSKPRA